MTDTDMIPPSFDPAPIDSPDESDYLDLGGVAVHGTKAERRALFKALAQAQRNYAPIVKDEVNPHFKKSYATLDAVLKGIMPALNDQGLALVNAVSDGAEGTRDLHTLLTHEGGAVFHMTLRMGKVDNIQQLGAQITYGRRYSIQCASCTAPEVDDDGNQGAGLQTLPIERQRVAPAPRQQERPPVREEPKNGHKSDPPPPLEPAPTPEREVEPAPVMMTDEQAGELKLLFQGYAKPQAAAFCKEITGMVPRDLTKAAADVLIFALKDKQAKEASQ